MSHLHVLCFLLFMMLGVIWPPKLAYLFGITHFGTFVYHVYPFFLSKHRPQFLWRKVMENLRVPPSNATPPGKKALLHKGLLTTMISWCLFSWRGWHWGVPLNSHKKDSWWMNHSPTLLLAGPSLRNPNLNWLDISRLSKLERGIIPLHGPLKNPCYIRWYLAEKKL